MASKIRERIVAKAMRCFAAHGFHGTSTRDIAEKANVTEGSLFRLCCSKEKLFTEALALALAAKDERTSHVRLVAFALLEDKGFTERNRKALAHFSARCQLIKDLRSITK
jgi:AcrR family transcriptional regulator